MRKVLLVLFTIGSLSAFGQKATIKGKIMDGEVNEPFPFATAQIAGSTIGASSDFDGNYSIKLDPGTYTVVFSFVGYTQKLVKDVVVGAGEVKVVNVTMEADKQKLDEVVVVGQRQVDNEAAAVEKVKISEQVVNAVSAQEISKIEASNAGDVVSRIPGITIVDGKFVIVRGLGQRYNSVQMNGMVMPSVDPSTKAFTFDIVPSSIIETALTYKSFSPNLSGEVAGGAININTINNVDQNFSKLSLKTGIRLGTTFQSTLGDPLRSTADVFALGKGSREWEAITEPRITEVQASSSDQIIDQNRREALSFDNQDFFAKSFTALPDFGASYNIGRLLELGGRELSFVGSASVSNSTKTIENELLRVSAWRNANAEIDQEIITDNRVPNDTTVLANDIQTSRVSKLMLMGNFKYNLSNKITIKFQNLYNRISNSSVIDRISKDFNANLETRIENVNYRDKIIFGSQLGGDIFFSDDFRNKLEVTAGFAQTRFNEPNRRGLFRQRNLVKGEDENNEPFITSIPFGGAALRGVTRFRSEMSENAYSFSTNYKYILKPSDEDDTKESKLNTGLYLERKQRDFVSRNIGYGQLLIGGTEFVGDNITDPKELFQNQNFGSVLDQNTTGIALFEKTQGVDTYEAASTTMAGYTTLSIPLGNLDINPGLRLENNVQTIQGPAIAQNSTIPLDVQIDNLNLLPYFNSTYHINDRNQIRAAYARTVNRPELRELAPFSYFDFELGVSRKGNPELQSATIDNIDLRYEFYPQASDLLGVALFYKNFDNPIEVVNISANDEFVPFNMESARLFGLEFEVRKTLGVKSRSRILNASSVLFNLALIKSEASLTNELPKAIEVNQGRPLQGQSPYVVNFGYYFADEESGISVNLNYNTYGKRLVVSEANGDRPPIYELPRHLLDLSIGKLLPKEWKVKIAGSNLLNAAYRLHFDGNFDEKIDLDSKSDVFFQSYREGQQIELSISKRF